MITLKEAQDKVQQTVKRLPPKPVLLSSVVGCVVAEDVVAPIDVPQFPRSAMDGIALRVADLKGNGPWSLPIQMVIEAGDTERYILRNGNVVKIMTGAPLAEGADTVVKVEDITIDSDNAVISEKPQRGAFVRPRGNDIQSGQVLFEKGTTLRPGDIGILASIGLTEVRVIPRPRIALISTGSEIVEPGRALEHGQIYDSNIPTLSSLLTYDGFPVTSQARVCTNDHKPLRATLAENLKNHDLVITTGAVSMGDFDFIPEIVEALGGRVLFHKVAVKPGKPTLIADFDGCWLVALPGNPVSTLVGYFLYIRRILSLMTGVPYEPRIAQATLADDIFVKGNRFNILGARLESTPQGLLAHPSKRQESGRLSSTRGIDALMMIEGGTRTVKKGSSVFVELTNHERLP
ncbi:MAG: molybdopterin molybdotransferase MoeA [Candidatus Zixiibacteriota bacterium]|nr:MAG: molybdopterin molybdotransferase MoeA [candidate division Zixibacteria bacterium]